MLSTTLQASREALVRDLAEWDISRRSTSRNFPRGVTRAIFLALETDQVRTQVSLFNYWQKRQAFTPSITAHIFDLAGNLIASKAVAFKRGELVQNISARDLLPSELSQFVGSIWLEARSAQLDFAHIGCVASYHAALGSSRVHSHSYVGVEARPLIPEQHVAVWSAPGCRSFVFFPTGSSGLPTGVTLELINSKGATRKASISTPIPPFGSLFAWIDEAFENAAEFLTDAPGWVRIDWRPAEVNKRALIGTMNSVTGTITTEHSSGYRYPKFLIRSGQPQFIERRLPWPDPSSTEFEVHFDAAATGANAVDLIYLSENGSALAQITSEITDQAIARIPVSRECPLTPEDRKKIHSVLFRLRQKGILAASPDMCLLWWPSANPHMASCANFGADSLTLGPSMLPYRWKPRLKKLASLWLGADPMVLAKKLLGTGETGGPARAGRNPSKWAPVLRGDLYRSQLQLINESPSAAECQIELWLAEKSGGSKKVEIPAGGSKIIDIDEAFPDAPLANGSSGFLFVEILSKAFPIEAYYWGIQRQTGHIYCDHLF